MIERVRDRQPLETVYIAGDPNPYDLCHLMFRCNDEFPVGMTYPYLDGLDNPRDVYDRLIAEHEAIYGDQVQPQWYMIGGLSMPQSSLRVVQWDYDA